MDISTIHDSQRAMPLCAPSCRLLTNSVTGAYPDMESRTTWALNSTVNLPLFSDFGKPPVDST